MNDISVIIPTYQHAATIGACIRSLLSQTEQPSQIIVVDDGSTDSTRELVRTFGEQVSYVYQANQGAPNARNAGAALATGAFLLFCDADVIAEPEMLKRLRETLTAHPEASYAYSGFRWGTRRFRARPFDPEALRKNNYIHSASLIRSSDFHGFDPTLKRFQDWDVWLTMLERGQHGVAIDADLFQIQHVPGRQGISAWLPSIAYRLPWRLIGWKPKALRAYEAAREVIVKKHSLS